jgi:uncharacterized protein YciI
MFIVMIHYKKSLEVVDEYLVAHRAYLEVGYQKDYFIASGPRNPRTGGIILSQLNDREKLIEILNQDPFQLNDIVEYEIIEFNPVKYHVNFASFVE